MGSQRSLRISVQSVTLQNMKSDQNGICQMKNSAPERIWVVASQYALLAFNEKPTLDLSHQYIRADIAEREKEVLHKHIDNYVDLTTQLAEAKERNKFLEQALKQALKNAYRPPF